MLCVRGGGVGFDTPKTAEGSPSRHLPASSSSQEIHLQLSQWPARGGEWWGAGPTAWGCQGCAGFCGRVWLPVLGELRVLPRWTLAGKGDQLRSISVETLGSSQGCFTWRPRRGPGGGRGTGLGRPPQPGPGVAQEARVAGQEEVHWAQTPERVRSPASSPPPGGAAGPSREIINVQ